MKSIALVVCCALPALAQAQPVIAPVSPSSAFPAIENFLVDSPQRAVGGDTFGAGVTVFTETQGGFLFDAPNTAYTFATDPDPGDLAFSGSLGTNFNGTRGSLFTNAVPGVTADTYDITVQWVGLDIGGNLASILPAGTNIDGSPITLIGFELGGPNVLNDTLDAFDPSFRAVEVLFNQFALFDASGAILFQGAVDGSSFDVSSGGLQAFVRLGAGGADLGDFNIAGGQLDVTVRFVPTPGGVGLIAIASLSAVRRRR